MDHWQPIDTAPKDGDLLMLAVDYGDGDSYLTIATAFYEEGDFEPGWYFYPADRMLRVAGEPTHWRPLPPVPSPMTCENCGTKWVAGLHTRKHRDAKYCSTRCRMAGMRARAKPAPPAA